MSAGNIISAVGSKNLTLAKHAATLEAGRLANIKLGNMIKPKLPMMMQGFSNHPFAKLAIANAVSMAITSYKPDNKLASMMSDAMIASAYQEVIASFDIEGMLEEFLSDKKLAKAFKELESPAE